MKTDIKRKMKVNIVFVIKRDLESVLYAFLKQIFFKKLWKKHPKIPTKNRINYSVKTKDGLTDIEELPVLKSKVKQLPL